MRVLKFGGTSVGTADRMQEVIDIIEKSDERQLVVLSAMSGTTNRLIEIATAIKEKEYDRAVDLIENLEQIYVRVLTDLYPDKEVRDLSRTRLRPSIHVLKSKLKSPSFNSLDEKEILAQGELMSTIIFSLQCEVRGLKSALIPACEFMRIDKKGEPEIDQISELIEPFISTLDEDIQIIITQGFICRNSEGRIDNLRRGGSDYTATILGAVLGVDEVQIWTDIDGFHNNDPRLVDDTYPIRKLSYREAAELAYFGAKILHPTCVLPAEKAGVPIRLKCTMTPETEGTLISTVASERPITALAAKDDITAIKIYSHRMLQAYGFLTKVFQVFENHRTPVDMITTSEVAVSLTIDDTTHLANIISDIQEFAEVESESGYAIVCIVGNALYDEGEHVHRIFEALREIPVRMVSMGGSRNNLSLLVKSEFKRTALISLNSLFHDLPELQNAEVL